MNIVKVCLYGFLTFLGYLILSQQIHVSHLKKTTQKDLNAIHETILKSYSNFDNNNQDTNNMQKVERAYQKAQDAITHMNSSIDHMNIIKTYIATIDDNLIHFFPTNNTSSINNSNNQEFHTIPLPSNIGKLQIPIRTCCPCATEMNHD